MSILANEVSEWTHQSCVCGSVGWIGLGGFVSREQQRGRFPRAPNKIGLPLKLGTYFANLTICILNCIFENI